MNESQISTGRLAGNLMPNWQPEDWFYWPPDIFAFTSILLQATGVYRYSVSPHPENNRRLLSSQTTEQREKRLSEISLNWYKWILGVRPELPDELKEHGKLLFSDECKLGPEATMIDFATSEALLDLHTIADFSSANFGLMTANLRGRLCAIHFLANYLLAVTGSLSRLAHCVGMVLPKMRTPQQGLTVRSFSHHLTFHRSEARVLWRSIPWNDAGEAEKTVNLVAVPIPYEISLEAFQPVNSSVVRSEAEAKGFRFFEYEPTEKFKPEKIIGLLSEANKELRPSRAHLLVFPESALTEEELEDLQSLLEEEMSVDKIPMIITGIREKGSPLGKNKVRLSVYFARKWHNLGQEKHHRWKLDRGQIEQYSLSRALDPDIAWWEAMDIAPRQLTFLVPNTWLTLCPLICEDLAQLEPISQLIRGVGPNLVISILLDGPQLPQRWPARYVGVLADDPGSGVLTLTSFGMAVRCAAPGMPESRVIALWKGQDSSWQPIELTEGSRAVLLSICAESKEEFTADGRSDGGAAFSLSLKEIHQLRPSKTQKFETRKVTKSEPEDLVDLTAFSFLSDAIIDAPSSLITEFRRRVGRKPKDKSGLKLIDAIKPFNSVWECIEVELRRQRAEAKKQGKPWSKQTFDDTVDELCSFIAPFNVSLDKLLWVPGESEEESTEKARQLSNPSMRLRQWTRIAEAAIKHLDHLDLSAANSGDRSDAEEDELMRLQMLYSSVLWAIFNRLEQRKSGLSNRHAKKNKRYAGKVDPELERAAGLPKHTASREPYAELEHQVKQTLARY